MTGYIIHPNNAKGFPVFAKTLDEAIKIKLTKSEKWVIQPAADVQISYYRKSGKPVYSYRFTGSIIEVKKL